MSADLIAKLERATGRDPELNRAIDEFDVRSRGKLAPDKPFCVEVSPDFTGSVDTALTLVPDGAFWAMKSAWHRRGYRVAVWVRPHTDTCAFHSDAKTPALALCIASLKARAALTVAA